MTQKLWLELTNQQRVALSQGESVVVSIPCERFMLVEKDPMTVSVTNYPGFQKINGVRHLLLSLRKDN